MANFIAPKTDPPQKKLLSINVPHPSNRINTTLTELGYLIKTLQRMYAPGAYWFSDDDTDPGEIIGGTWERVSGQFIFGAGHVSADAGIGEGWGVGDEGGTVAHRHYTSIGADGDLLYVFLGTGEENGRNPYYGSEVIDRREGFNIKKSNDINNERLRIAFTAHERNMPPFRATNIWRRVS